MAAEDLANAAKACPTGEALRAYLAGKLPGPAVEQVGNHVAACSTCQVTLENVLEAPEGNDSLIGKLRGCVLRTASGEPAGDNPLKNSATTALNQEPLTSTGAARPAGPPPWVPRAGEPFGQYQLVEPIGEGGMGVVYKAWQKSLKRTVAIKMIRAGTYASASEKGRFQVEGEAIARLQHPYVVQVHEFNEHNGQPYLSMELLEGGTLASKLTKNGLPLQQAAQLVQTLACAVEAAHQRHIIHRDLKPANVLLDAQGSPKIGDFGLARLLDTEGGPTASNVVMGTPSYMAPEQAQGQAKDVGPLVDVYALGAILYEALTGRPPFKGESKLHTLDLVRTVPPTRPTQLRREVPRDLEAICLKCLEKEPARRYASAEALAQDLGRWLRGEMTEARPLPWYGRAWRRLPKRMLAAALLVLAALALLLFFRPNPNAAVRDIEARLARGQAVTLIGESGQPRWSRWHTNKGASMTVAGDGTFQLESWSLALLELVRDPQVDHYVITAEVKQERGQGSSPVGLFFGLTDYPKGDVTHLFFQRAVFSEIPFPERTDKNTGAKLTAPVKNPVYLGSHLYTEGPNKSLWDQIPFGEKSPRLFEPAGVSGGPWRKLAVEVSPMGVRGIWGGQEPLGEVTAEKIKEGAEWEIGLRQQIRPQRPDDGRISPRFNPRGTLGLYVYMASASFRRVVIKPIGNTIQPH
jgi:serine/threonine-protein kinase